MAYLLLSINVQHLMADGLQVVHIQCVEVLPPPRARFRLRGHDQIKFGQLAGQVDEGYGDGLRLPLQTKTGTQAEGEGGGTLSIIGWTGMQYISTCHS